MTSRAWRLTAAVVAVLTLGLTAALNTRTTPVEAADWAIGDVFLGVANGSYQVRAPNGTLKETVNSGLGGFTTGCAFDSKGNLYTTQFSANQVTVFANAHPHASSSFGSGYATPESIAFDATGKVYVGNVGGGGIRQFNADGTFVKTILPGTRVDWFDIAADNDTILYTQEGNSILRVSISTGASLSSFTTGTAVHAFALRLLADGGVLLADQVNVKRYNSAGAVIQTYSVAGEGSWFSLNLDPNGTSFWAGNFNTANYYRFNIATGAVELGPFNTGTGSSTLFGICILGEVTAAQALKLAPLEAFNKTGTAHTVTATLSPPKAGVNIKFTVLSGPNAGKTGTVATDAMGVASFTYTGTGGAGTDVIEAQFTTDTGTVVKSNQVKKVWDSTSPSCTLTAVIAGPPKQLQITAQDTGSGLGSIVVTKSVNASTPVPAFTVGTTAAVVVTATKIDQTLGAQVELTVTDRAGNVTICDPVLTTLVKDEGKPEIDRIRGVDASEHVVRVINGDPGLRRLVIEVNGVEFELDHLRAGETRTVDVAKAMQPGTRNTFVLRGHGKKGASADILIWDGK